MIFTHRLLSRFLRFFFKLLYHQFAWTYDWVAAFVSAGMWKDWVLASLPYLDGPIVLEIGHGPGHLQVALHGRGLKPFALDQSAQMSRMAYTRLSRLGYEAMLVNGYAQFAPFPDKAFHQVVATFPSEYISEQQTLAEIYRLLVDGGKLVVLPVAWITGRLWPHRLAAWLFRVTGQAPQWDEKFAVPFEQAGFEVHIERKNYGPSCLLFLLAHKPHK